MDAVVLDAQPRTVLGKKVKQLRRQGIMPIHLYGKEVSPLSLQADAHTLQRVLAQAGRTALVTVRVDGEDHMAFVREVQRHPVTGQMLHMDFLQVALTERMVSEVPIHLVGEAPAMRVLGGSLLQNLYSLEVESLPTDIPSEIRVDISSLDDFEKAIHASDISLGPNVTILTDPEAVVARVQPPRAEEKEEVVEAVAPAEVEVVKKAEEKAEKEGSGKE